MANEIIDFDATKHAIATAQNVAEVISIRDKMAALIAFYKSGKDPENARKAAEIKLLAEVRMGEMSATLEKREYHGGRNGLGGAQPIIGKIETLKSAGVSPEEASMFERLAKMPKEELAKAAREGKSARSILRSKPRRMTPDELAAAGHPRTTERYDTGGGESKSRIKLISDENRSLKAENVKLKEEIVRLNNDLVAIQTGQIMRMSREALEQRRAILAKQKTKREQRLTVETTPDEKTKEDYERQIQRLKTQLNNEKAKAASMTLQRNVVSTISNEDRKFLLVLVHPDRATDSNDRAKRERAFKLINAIPELVDA